jgi:hypothetical protein
LSKKVTDTMIKMLGSIKSERVQNTSPVRCYESGGFYKSAYHIKEP